MKRTGLPFAVTDGSARSSSSWIEVLYSAGTHTATCANPFR